MVMDLLLQRLELAWHLTSILIVVTHAFPAYLDFDSINRTLENRIIIAVYYISREVVMHSLFQASECALFS